MAEACTSHWGTSGDDTAPGQSILSRGSSGHIVHWGQQQSGPWLKQSSGSRERRAQSHGGEHVLEILTSSPPAFLLQPLASCQDLTSLGDTYTSHPLPSEVPHPGRNVSDSFTGYDTLIVEKAFPRVSLLSIKGQHMAGHIQVHAGTTWIGMINSVNCKINAVRVFLRVEYMPGLVSISTHISRAYFLGRVAKVGDCFLGVFS